jgi:hypothetical protein
VNPGLKKVIWQEMRSLGDRLKHVLEPDPRHPRGRNPYAHVAGCVRDHFGCSYGDLADERVGELRNYLQELEEKEKERCGFQARSEG